MRAGSLSGRLRWALRAAIWGSLSIAADALGQGAAAARLGMRALEGVARAELESWARASLTPKAAALAVLERLAAEAPSLRLVVVSRGTPACAIRAFLARHDVRQALAGARVLAPVEIRAPELELAEGRFTGRIAGPVARMCERFAEVPEGAVFLGDRHDQRRVLRLKDRRFRFERV